MKLATLQPRIATAGARLSSLDRNAMATPRLRGRAGVERRARWLEQHPLCVDCEAEGRVTAGEEVDHQVPLCDGGADDESNLATRCKACHAKKSAREASERAGNAL